MSTKAPDLSPQAQDEIASAAEQAQRESDPAKDVRQWLLSTKSATLCTLSCRSELLGYPFGSIVPFAVDGMGRPFIMIADIAAHTANLRADARASLFVSDAKAQGDPQKTWRVGLVGTMQRVLPEGKESAHLNSSQVIESTDYLDLHARYVERVPKAVDYLRQHSFDYWRMNSIVTARYIAGFGRICWVEGDSLLREPISQENSESVRGAIAHMNKDHVENMKEMCDGIYGISPATVTMSDLDRTGLSLTTTEPDRRLHFSFGREIEDDEIRGAVIGVLKRARALGPE